jgi:hypothetical protein
MVSSTSTTGARQSYCPRASHSSNQVDVRARLDGDGDQGGAAARKDLWNPSTTSAPSGTARPGSAQAAQAPSGKERRRSEGAHGVGRALGQRLADQLPVPPGLPGLEAGSAPRPHRGAPWMLAAYSTMILPCIQEWTAQR